ncbi:MAG: PDZ domain-containing protein [Sediminibacterium sp.]|nr:PDZ domain-containing protein [Sediminibacterium sp.]MBP6144497.1 PDZ domain-containing protein [Sediminibacterium sp.]
MKKTLLLLSCMGLFSFVKAQEAGSKTKEVIIEKKVTKPNKVKVDSSMQVTVMINGDTTENISIVMDGEKITINGEEANADDPRLKKIKRGNVQGFTIQPKSNRQEGVSKSFVFKKPNQPNLAFLGVVTSMDPAGAMIVDINEASPAAKAKLKIGDIITSVNETKIKHPEDLYAAIGKYKPNDKITLGYTRENKSAKVTINLEKNTNTKQGMTLNGDEIELDELEMLTPKGGQYQFSFPELPNMDQLMTRADKKTKLGISVEDLETGKGVKVTNVTAESPAAKAGIQKEDLLLNLNDAEITDVNFMKWQYYFPGQVLKITLERKGEKRTIEVKIPKKINTADL